MTGCIDELFANRIWDMLVEVFEAREDEQDTFVRYVGEGGTEYRFMGNLGFGGKFYNETFCWRVGCYPEDETEQLKALIERVNRNLTDNYDVHTANYGR